MDATVHRVAIALTTAGSEEEAERSARTLG